MASISPTQRSLKHLREGGWTAAVVERWNSYVKIRQDLFGGIDIVALKAWPFQGVTGVQSTSDSNVAARRTKLLAIPEMRLWVECGNRLVIHGWGKKGARGKVKKWTLREVDLKIEDFDKHEKQVSHDTPAVAHTATHSSPELHPS